MEKALRSVFPLSFLTETQQRLAGEKKKDVVRPPICVVCSVSFLPSAVHAMSAKRQRKRAKKNHTARSVLRRKPPLGFLLRSPTTWRKKKKKAASHRLLGVLHGRKSLLPGTLKGRALKKRIDGRSEQCNTRSSKDGFFFR